LHKQGRNFLSSWIAVSFSRTFLHGVVIGDVNMGGGPSGVATRAAESEGRESDYFKQKDLFSALNKF
jgi:hypothetical protein